MERWKLYAFAAALFAGLTSVIAKAGLKVLGADLGLAVRTVFVFTFIMLNTFIWIGPAKATAALQTAGWRPIGLLALSGVTTTLSWVCYYRAMHEGTVLGGFPPGPCSFVTAPSTVATVASGSEA